MHPPLNLSGQARSAAAQHLQHRATRTSTSADCCSAPASGQAAYLWQPVERPAAALIRRSLGRLPGPQSHTSTCTCVSQDPGSPVRLGYSPAVARSLLASPLLFFSLLTTVLPSLTTHHRLLKRAIVRSGPLRQFLKSCAPVRPFIHSLI